MIKINTVQPDILPLSFHTFQPNFANFIAPVMDQWGKKENISEYSDGVCVCIWCVCIYYSV